MSQMPGQVMPPIPQPPAGGLPMGGEEMVSEEEKQVLLDLIAQIKSKLGNLNATKFAADDKSEQMRQEILRQVFEKLQLAGVDLSSRESVGAFIMRLQEQNPELAQMFEKSMDVLLGGNAFSAEDSTQAPVADDLIQGQPDPNTLGMIG